MGSNLTGSHKSTYDAIFRHPIARNIQWHDVRALLGALAEVKEENGTSVKFERNGVTLALHRPRGKDISDAKEVMQIRHFLERSEGPTKPAVAEGIHLLVVVDHREARVFRTEMHGAKPQHIVAYEAKGPNRYLHNVENDGNGQRKPEPKEFYKAIAHALEGAESILIFGSATGSSSAMDHLAAGLKEHHPEIARHVVGTVVVNEKHLSDDQLLAEARAFYEARTTTAVV